MLTSTAIVFSLLGLFFLLLGCGLVIAGKRANQVDWGPTWLNLIDGLIRLFCRHYHRFEFQPIPMPKQGAAILASNHISGLDPLLLIAASQRPIRFMIATEEYQRFGLNWLFRAAGCIPVDRTGQSQQAFRQALKALDDGEVVAMFPEGGIHLDNAPPRQLKRGVATLTKLTGVPIYPVRMAGIRGKGHTLLAVVLPSQARLYNFDPLICDDLEEDDCLDRLAGLFKSTTC